jgi:hypothetical protein
MRSYSDVQKSVPVKSARLLPYITMGFYFDSHPRIDSVFQKPGFRYGPSLWTFAIDLRYGLFENAIYAGKIEQYLANAGLNVRNGR